MLLWSIWRVALETDVGSLWKTLFLWRKFRKFCEDSKRGGGGQVMIDLLDFGDFSLLTKSGASCKYLLSRLIKLYPRSPCLWALVWPCNPCFIPQFKCSCKGSKTGYLLLKLGIDTSFSGFYFDKYVARVHRGNLIVFRFMVQELLKIEQFCERKSKKIKYKHFRKIGASSWCYWKAFDDLDFLEVIW